MRNEVAVVCEFYRAMADDRNIKIEILGNAKIQANQLMLRRALNNILSNALKYSERWRLGEFQYSGKRSRIGMKSVFVIAVSGIAPGTLAKNI